MKQSAKLLLCFFLLLFSKTAYLQDTSVNKYGLVVIKDIEVLKQQIAINPSKKMLPVGAMVPTAIINLKYADSINFLHKKLYPPNTGTYLRRAALVALTRVQQSLQKQGLSIIIWDAYRPYSITEMMWEAVMDDRYTANPAAGSAHNRGTAVDLSLADIASGKELDMGTGFDDFSEKAHHGYAQLPAQVIKNRALLREVMEKNGFKALETEWWHYYLPDASSYELLDISFETLAGLQ